MTDEKFVFNQDVRERSKMKTGAQHRKNGCKSKKCTLPYEYLSRKERQKLNGQVSSIIMNKPYYDWKSFITLPETMQVEYLSGLIANYGARVKDLAEMFGVHYSTFWTKSRNYIPALKFGTGKKMDERWLDFITTPGFADMPKKTEKKAPKKSVTDIPTKHTEEIKKEETPVEKETKNAFEGVRKFDLSMSGSKDVLLSVLKSALSDNCEYAMTITLTRVNGIPAGVVVRTEET